MEVMAQRTGGRAFHNVNDLAGAIRQAVEESRVTYLLGYYPANRNPQNVTLEEKEGKWVGLLELFVARGNAKTGNFAGKPVRVNIQFAADAHEGFTKRGLTLLQDVPMPAEANEIRVAVRDVPSGAVGSVILRGIERR